MFWNNFVNQCEKIEKSPTVVVEDLGFKRSAVTSWKNGALPQVKNRKKIADYFGISVEELMGTKKSPPGKASSKENGPTLKWLTRVQHRKHVQQPKPPRWPCWRAARKKDDDREQCGHPGFFDAGAVSRRAGKSAPAFAKNGKEYRRLADTIGSIVQAGAGRL